MACGGEFESPLYERCTDPECPYLLLVRAHHPTEGDPHYHFLGSPWHPRSVPEREA